MNNNFEFERRVFPDDLSMSPVFVLQRINAIIKKYGVDLVRSKSVFKKTREMWTAAIFLLLQSRLQNKKFWLQPEYTEGTPDVKAFSCEPHQKFVDSNKRLEYDIEITDLINISEKTLLQIVLKKISKQFKYPDNFILVVDSRQLWDSRIDIEGVYRKLKEVSINIAQIWFFSSIKGDVSCMDTLLVCLYPQLNKKLFSLKEVISGNSAQEELIIWERKSGLAKDVKGIAYLQLPDLPMNKHFV